jgi:hypothetical protein
VPISTYPHLQGSLASLCEAARRGTRRFTNHRRLLAGGDGIVGEAHLLRFNLSRAIETLGGQVLSGIVPLPDGVWDIVYTPRQANKYVT